MPNKIIKPLLFIVLLSCSANGLANFKIPGLNSFLNYDDNFSFSNTSKISTKRGEKYDESKDPALRRGTENWEEPQGSYFAIPALIVGLIGLALFFSRDK